MQSLPPSIRALAKELSELPAIGPRQATRLAIYLAGPGRAALRGIAQGLSGLTNVETCPRCFYFFEPSDEGSPREGSPEWGEATQNDSRTAPANLCEICENTNRNAAVIMIVEKETDLMSLENVGTFRGRYLVLGEMPKTGLLEDWQKKRLAALRIFIEKNLGGAAEEIILALNPTSLGDFHASLLSKELSALTKKLSRLGRGLPSGGEIEFADGETLGSALEGRT